VTNVECTIRRGTCVQIHAGVGRRVGWVVGFFNIGKGVRWLEGGEGGEEEMLRDQTGMGRRL